MKSISDLTDTEVEELLIYSGFVFVAFELVKSLVVNPTKLFYKDSTFGHGLPFTNYEFDVLLRHKNPFEASLLYLRSFMGTIDSEDLITIQKLRKHRNDLAHNLPNMLASIDTYVPS